ncbi:MAG: hypothetical protein GKR89_16535 [Candidatus Latescibacteria bacterium]|nr:hypothetical protein [Candidatus Latescibacterota bacterium]
MTQDAEGLLWWLISFLLVGLAAFPAQAAFEFVGQGARSTALGGAYVAAVQTAEAVWYNPAGNARADQWLAGTTHLRLYPNVDRSPSLNALNGAGPLWGGGLQAGLSLLGAPGWREEVATLAYGRALHPRIALGGGLNTKAWKAGNLSRRVWSVDLGALYEVGWIHPLVYLRLGLVGRNLTRPNIAVGGQDAGQTPRAVVLAAAFVLAEQEFLVDLERSGGRTALRAGYETRTVSLAGARFRFGGSAMGPNWSNKELDVGLGHDWKQWHFDYAYTYSLHLTELGGGHRLSVGYRTR